MIQLYGITLDVVRSRGLRLYKLLLQLTLHFSCLYVFVPLVEVLLGFERVLRAVDSTHIFVGLENWQIFSELKCSVADYKISLV